MKKITLGFSLLLALLFSSCEYFNIEEETDLSTEEIIDGLKTALAIGTDSASTSLSKLDGYYHGVENLVKIPLPDEAISIRNKINGNNTLAAISSLIGLDGAFEDVILSVNRAAEDAAHDAAPIFKGAITSLTISQGWDILNGIVPGDSTKAADFDSTAATQFLKLKTYDDLTNLYAPKIDVSLRKDIIGSVSAYDAWNTLTTKYNNFINRADVTAAITLANFLGTDIDLPDAIETDIGVFSTQKALNGLFYMVGNEEKKIRKDPFEWAIDIIQRVFGYIQDQFAQ
jgi:hypothetical protein